MESYSSWCCSQECDNDQLTLYIARASSGTLGLGKRQLDAYLTNFRICYTFTRDEFIPNPEASLIKVNLGVEKLPAVLH